MKMVIGDPKTGKTYQVDVPSEKEVLLYGKKIGDEIEGDVVGLGGYVFVITGGSDKSGFPMRKDVHGSRKIKTILSGGVGFNPTRKGERRKKTVRGNTVSAEIAQLNVKVVKDGASSLEEMLGKKEEKKE
jgi:small subunit ribosomal protein S6e